MPDQRAEAESHVLPGIYEHYLKRAREKVAAPDPRCFLVDEGPKRDALIEEDRRRCSADPAYRRAKYSVANIDRLEAGLPLHIPKWILGGHTWPMAQQWKDFRDPEVTMYRMFPDDHLEPVRGESEFLDPADMAPNRSARRSAKRKFNL
jgi:hypothetical protein